jgi:regulator of sirC expression with transglutaminase-like and TPR domain
MIENKKVDALIRLLDDRDEEIFQHIESTLFSFGEQVIEPLEQAWENSFDSLLQERIENLIHKIQFNTVLKDLELWHISGSFDLLQGLLIINRYQYPDLEEQKIINQIEDIKREIWMQMIYKMNPVEKVRLVNTVFFTNFGFSGNTKRYHDPQNSYLSQVLETKKGNPILLASIYSIIAQKLDMPIYGVNLPRHFILAYTDDYNINTEENEVLFYINPFNRGQVFGKHDVLSFLKQLNLPADPSYFQPCTNVEIIARVIRNLIGSYEQNAMNDKVQELNKMLKLIDS